MESLPPQGQRSPPRQTPAEQGPSSSDQPSRSPSSKPVDSSPLSQDNQTSSTQPSSTQPSSTQPSSTQPSSTQPSSTQPSSTQPSSTQPSSTQRTDNSQQQNTESQSESRSEPRKCWICFSDETEDTPQNASTWKTPCPCALEAHESCLLDWIADMEAPQNGRAASPQKEIKCPQCKSEIHLARPHSLVVDLVGRAEKAGGQMLLPTVVMGTLYAFMIAASHHGAHSIRMIFGSDDAEAILAPSPFESAMEIHMRKHFPVLASHFFRRWRGWRVEFGLPIIPAALVASRTHLADTILPLLPIAFFATHPDTSELTQPFWPPSAALTVVVLPYVRGIYKEYMERVWGEREKAWMKEIHPRLGGGERTNDGEGEDGDTDDEDDDGDLVQLQIDIEEDVQEDGDGDQAAAAPPDIAPDHAQDQAQAAEGDQGQRQPPDQEQGQQQQEGREAAADGARPLRELLDEAQRVQDAAGRNRQGNNNGEQQGQGQQQQGDQDQEEGHHHHHHRVDVNLLTYATSIAETTVGALFFPSVCNVMGEVLRYALPPAWTMATKKEGGRLVPSGLLQTRWGRGIIGGCLFVVMKDAARIYCKWKMAQSYRKRRVLNYDKKQGRVVE